MMTGGRKSSMNAPSRHLLAAAAVLGLVGGGAALRSGLSPAHAAPTALTDGSIPDVAERVVDSVVNISTESTVQTGAAAFDPFFSDPMSPAFGQQEPDKQMSKGSGVIVTASGRILTNAHVVERRRRHQGHAARRHRLRREGRRRRRQGRPRRDPAAGQAARAQAAPVRATRRRCGSARSCSRSATRSASARP